MISLGGALGSALVGIVAPLVLPAYFELAGGLVVAALLLLWQVRRGHIVFGALAAAAVLGTAGCAIWAIVQFYDDTIVATRNFYGVLRVQELGRDTANHRRSLIHGTILHGTQYMEPEFRRRPTTYYTPSSGIGLLLEVAASVHEGAQGRRDRPRRPARWRPTAPRAMSIASTTSTPPS